jgi:hypothetical protein
MEEPDLKNPTPEIGPPDRPLEVLAASKVPVRVLMALAVEERSGPMTYEEIVERLKVVGVDRPPASLKRAWRGQRPLRERAVGRLNLVETFCPSHSCVLAPRLGGEKGSTGSPELTPGSYRSISGRFSGNGTGRQELLDMPNAALKIRSRPSFAPPPTSLGA